MKQVMCSAQSAQDVLHSYGNVGDLEECEISGFLDKLLLYFESLVLTRLLASTFRI